MARVTFTSNQLRHVDCCEQTVEANSVREALNQVFQNQQNVRSYVLDDQNRLRTHMAIFINGRPLLDRESLSDPVNETSEIYVMQALSGG